ncbi:MAG: hypothetical protein LAO06_12405 [Acidobacteriia bacterium]|nr:hypothetical protein [Terriglobia bacterium]
MDREEYKAFLAHLFAKYVRPRLLRGGRWHHPMQLEEWAWELERLQKALILLSTLEQTCDDTDDIYRTFTTEGLKSAVSSVSSGVRNSQRMMRDAGFLDVMESYLDEIIADMQADDIPDEDLLVLQAIHPNYGRLDIQEVIIISKKRGSRFKGDQQSITTELERIDQSIESQAKRLDNLESKPTTTNDRRPKRKWYKALGHIGEGAVLAIADVSLAMGVLPVVASVETASWGTIVSAAAGVGKMFDGFGELCGE